MTTALAWLRDLLTDLFAWLLRRPLDLPPGHRPLSHSTDLKQDIWLIAGANLVTGVALDFMLPAAFRPYHLTLEAVVAITALGAAAMIARNPHLVGDDHLHIRTGPFGHVQVPLNVIRAVTHSTETVDGHGVRRVVPEDDTLACSVGGSTNLLLELDEPILVPLRKAPPFKTTRIRFAADDPSAAIRAISIDR